MEYTHITAAEFANLDGLDDWRVILGAARSTFRAGSFPAAAELVTEIAAAAERAAHHPDVEVRYPDRVIVTLATHATGGLTTLDVDLAREISRLAAERGASTEPATAQLLELAIDTTDADLIRPFWAAVLDYRDDGDGNLIDPRREGPAVWFQQMDPPRTDRNRFHVDVSVANDAADARVAAAVAAGGTLVSDARARAFWVLADAEGNEACVCTWQDR